ncbi:ribonuclease HII [Candidatus Falkowbacteria bacterium CG_4_9_14_3_um_filter_36_9]|uniref:Ribonuclease HII n=2 Tax=Candidatus Falkowiibacteriota TaxID=1752728 RepID=A0A1J4T8X7_9BACT|nr:MAG: ribonuclease HII [Candidatus Falkowbacteria bacterium CG1_02_37_44]PIV51935.1 MAG: ribonuclease HII [Candidatus Falkowbacteria bacterium CG02_land_8_20_14_3_00_36_14]PIX12102.1 MAG: ribonuclease HII [Candidatus Falkowbacteria bacterium CG_4_8_14_3_um_filter_36_11]PJB19898.1 MAG: ribonuclease HII [Candidatus Falkowbacteria bacterium CG_4_9_14_3_um_filter_36_9]
MNREEEKKIFNEGFNIIGAIDEAGRGPLAGPVVAACVAFSRETKFNNKKLEQINDSKKLSVAKREELDKIIREEFDEVGIGVCDHKTIDRINILQASFLAMKKAVGALKKKPDYLMVDGGLLIPNISLKQKAIISGDSLVFSIAAASIIAKVVRDKIMREMHIIYPNYGFDKHKGYGTAWHLQNLKKYGPCPIHRKSFRPVKMVINK